MEVGLPCQALQAEPTSEAGSLFYILPATLALTLSSVKSRNTFPLRDISSHERDDDALQNSGLLTN